MYLGDIRMIRFRLVPATTIIVNVIIISIIIISSIIRNRSRGIDALCLVFLVTIRALRTHLRTLLKAIIASGWTVGVVSVHSLGIFITPLPTLPTVASKGKRAGLRSRSGGGGSGGSVWGRRCCGGGRRKGGGRGGTRIEVGRGGTICGWGRCLALAAGKNIRSRRR